MLSGLEGRRAEKVVLSVCVCVCVCVSCFTLNFTNTETSVRGAEHSRESDRKKSPDADSFGLFEFHSVQKLLNMISYKWLIH